MSGNETYQAGLAVRRQVLGEKYVDDAMANADAFMKPLQDYLTEHAWGASWARGGLSLKTRSMLNLAMLTALNRPHELRIHLRGAIRNGVTREEMQEIFLQCGVYCGAPAALESFKIAKEVLAEEAGCS
jgi:4-carboxymuconolactone decarboxylase